MADENNITIMDNTINIADYFVKSVGEGAYNVYFKALTEQDQRTIEDWLKDNIQYNDVQGAPELPSDNKAYDENNNIKPFDKLAFTADYDDLNNAPTIPDIGGERPTAFNPIAFTGVVNLDNVAVSNVINLNEYSINSNDAEHIAGMTANDISDNNTKLQNIGSSDNFVKGLNAFQRNGNGILLFNTLQSKIISGGFLITKTPTYLVSNNGIYFLTDVKNTTWDGPTLQYFELHLVAVTDSNYTTIRTYEANITDETAEEILENIELTAKNVILIFDFSNNILYCKTKEIGKEQEQGILEETDPIFAASIAANITNGDIENWNNKSNFSGNYEDLNGAPSLPKDIENNSKAYYTINEGETNEERKIKPLQLISFTNDYNDLNHKPNHLNNIINVSIFSNSNISNQENEKMLSLGQENAYILNFMGFKNDQEILLSNVLLETINNYINYGKEIIIVNSINRYKIININRTLSNANELTPAFITLDFISFNENNYTSIQYSGNSFDETEAQNQLSNLTITSKTGTLVFDYINDVIYCKIKSF